MRSLNTLSGGVAAFVLASTCWIAPASADEYKTMDIQTPDVSKCLDIDTSGLFGSFKNSCEYRVAFVMCVVEPTAGSWGAANPCVDGQAPKNLDFVAANGVQASHIKGGKLVQWFACRHSTTPGVGNYTGIMSGSVVYEKGRGIQGKCGLTSKVLTSISEMPPTAGELAKQGNAAQPKASAGAGAATQSGKMASGTFGNPAPQGGTQPVAAPALPAQQIIVPRNLPFATRWTVRDVGRGCHMVLRDSDLMWDESGENINGMIRRLDWSGGCNAARLADGRGTLTVLNDNLFGQGRHTETGNASNGILSGSFSFTDESNEGSGWYVWSDDAGRRSWNGILSNGCSSDSFEPCNSADAIIMRNAFIGGLASARPVPQNPVKRPVYTPAPPPASFDTRPVPPANLGAIIGAGYPDAAIAQRQQGRVAFMLTVGPTGAVVGCQITQSSGFPALDQSTCTLFQTKVVFQPARNANGLPVQSKYSSSVFWKLPTE